MPPAQPQLAGGWLRAIQLVPQFSRAVNIQACGGSGVSTCHGQLKQMASSCMRHQLLCHPMPAVCSWTIPSNIPVSGFGGQSLFGLFTSSIAENLAKFPTGPSIDDPFW